MALAMAKFFLVIKLGTASASGSATGSGTVTASA